MEQLFTDLVDLNNNVIIQTLFVILLALVAQAVVKILIVNTLRFPLNNDLFPSPKRDREKRIKTLTSIATTTAILAIWFFAFVIIMGIFNVPVGPLLTSAGLVGAAIAFGMQSLIKDFISGIFIISENQYRIDDYIQLDKVAGKVEAITVRTTVLRDKDGSLHHVPNGTINLTTNLSMGPLKVYEQLEVDASISIEQLQKKLAKIAATIDADVELHKLIKDGPHIDTVTKTSAKSTNVAIVFTTTAAKKDAATTALWQAIKESDIPLA